MERKILHLDLDAFFCAVEELRDPRLKGKAFAVGGRPQERGVIASCSYPARRYGIHSAMPTAQALRLYPDLIIIGGRHRQYEEMSVAVMQRVHNLTPLVEQVSIDEAFMDVSDSIISAEAIARQLQKQIQNELNLPCSLGAASNKLVAKIANDVGKAANRGLTPPNAITIVPPGQEVGFLAPLPVDALWGVGPKTAARLKELGIQTISDLARWPETELVRRFGKNGYDLARHARGIDESPIVTSRPIKSISQETTFVKDVRDEEVLKQTLLELSEQVGKRLRAEELSGTTVKIKIRWPDFTTLTRQATLAKPFDQDQLIYESALDLFHKVWKQPQAVRLIGVGVSGFERHPRQLSLWDIEGVPTAIGGEKERRLQAAIDEIHNRFGDRVLKRGNKPS